MTGDVHPRDRGHCRGWLGMSGTHLGMAVHVGGTAGDGCAPQGLGTLLGMAADVGDTAGDSCAPQGLGTGLGMAVHPGGRGHGWGQLCLLGTQLGMAVHPRGRGHRQGWTVDVGDRAGDGCAPRGLGTRLGTAVHPGGLQSSRFARCEQRTAGAQGEPLSPGRSRGSAPHLQRRARCPGPPSPTACAFGAANRPHCLQAAEA